VRKLRQQEVSRHFHHIFCRVRQKPLNTKHCAVWIVYATLHRLLKAILFDPFALCFIWLGPETC
jgi:hypothetical protein